MCSPFVGHAIKLSQITRLHTGPTNHPTCHLTEDDEEELQVALLKYSKEWQDCYAEQTEVDPINRTGG